MPIDHGQARALLEKLYAKSQEQFSLGKPSSLPEEKIREGCEIVFQSNTQSYREILLGCTVARSQDRAIDIRRPYVDLGERSFSGRTLDERVVNPFLQDKQIPCSKGPYLAVFRRQVQFDQSSRGGMKDKTGYDALMICLTHLESLTGKKDVERFISYLLSKFIALREAANIGFRRIH